MDIILITLLAAVSLAIVAYPLFVRRGGSRLGQQAEDLAERLRRDRDRVYEEIRVLQQERFLSNISEEAYESQLREARLHAARLMQEQQTAQETLETLDGAVEAELEGLAHGPEPGREEDR